MSNNRTSIWSGAWRLTRNATLRISHTLAIDHRPARDGAATTALAPGARATQPCGTPTARQYMTAFAGPVLANTPPTRSPTSAVRYIPVIASTYSGRPNRCFGGWPQSDVFMSELCRQSKPSKSVAARCGKIALRAKACFPPRLPVTSEADDQTLRENPVMKRLLALFILIACVGAAQAQDKPNIVFFLLDNVGWAISASTAA